MLSVLRAALPLSLPATLLAPFWSTRCKTATIILCAFQVCCRSLLVARRSLHLCLSLPFSAFAKWRPKMSKFRFAIKLSAQPMFAHHEGGQRRPAPTHSVPLIDTRRQRLTSAVLQAGRTTSKLGFGNSIKLLYFHRQTKLRMPGLTKSAERYLPL